MHTIVICLYENVKAMCLKNSIHLEALSNLGAYFSLEFETITILLRHNLTQPNNLIS